VNQLRHRNVVVERFERVEVTAIEMELMNVTLGVVKEEGERLSD